MEQTNFFMEEMRKRRITPGGLTFSHVLQGYIKNHCPEEVEATKDIMKQLRLWPSVMACTKMALAYADLGDVKNMAELISQAESLDSPRPNVSSKDNTTSNLLTPMQYVNLYTKLALSPAKKDTEEYSQVQALLLDRITRTSADLNIKIENLMRYELASLLVNGNNAEMNKLYSAVFPRPKTPRGDFWIFMSRCVPLHSDSALQSLLQLINTAQPSRFNIKKIVSQQKSCDRAKWFQQQFIQADLCPEVDLDFAYAFACADQGNLDGHPKLQDLQSGLSLVMYTNDPSEETFELLTQRGLFPIRVVEETTLGIAGLAKQLLENNDERLMRAIAVESRPVFVSRIAGFVSRLPDKELANQKIKKLHSIMEKLQIQMPKTKTYVKRTPVQDLLDAIRQKDVEKSLKLVAELPNSVDPLPVAVESEWDTEDLLKLLKASLENMDIRGQYQNVSKLILHLLEKKELDVIEKIVTDFSDRLPVLKALTIEPMLKQLLPQRPHLWSILFPRIQALPLQDFARTTEEERANLPWPAASLAAKLEKTELQQMQKVREIGLASKMLVSENYMSAGLNLFAWANMLAIEGTQQDWKALNAGSRHARELTQNQINYLLRPMYSKCSLSPDLVEALKSSSPEGIGKALSAQAVQMIDTSKKAQLALNPTHRWIIFEKLLHFHKCDSSQAISDILKHTGQMTSHLWRSWFSSQDSDISSTKSILLTFALIQGGEIAQLARQYLKVSHGFDPHRGHHFSFFQIHYYSK
ncbi:hypothetical protein Ciccas_003628 [Cichlidogyrus casuarinus]|uniref:Leucine-rich PPR motif-containing protein, mitochondrial n=1 Tax=Cichlidogyrus casuarinus TaxID=1844966 RepID=A0ABD2QE97_9PLAT